jgi:hypothetical protein
VDDLTRRALKAYWRRRGMPADIPANYSGLEEWHGRTFVVLRNCNGPLAVYRVQPAGRLRELDDWPVEIEAW